MTASVPDQTAALAEAVGLLTSWLPTDELEAARGVIAKTAQRQRLADERTVVALAGATGSGKSSVFNALVGLDLAETGARRPTTGRAMACVWGAEGSGDLLDWLGIDQRHVVVREGPLAPRAGTDLAGLVLVDLPDHDSVVLGHRLAVDRLVELVDLLVWVVDPQKYADASLHTGYLSRLTPYARSMLVVLNQVDRLAEEQHRACRDDLRRILDEEGLEEVPLLTASARSGQGVSALRVQLQQVLAQRRAATARVLADLSATADRLAAASGLPAASDLPRATDRAAAEGRLVAGLATAAGVDAVVAAVEGSTRRVGSGRTGWPLTRWARRIRPDPLRRLGLDRPAGRQGTTGDVLTRSGIGSLAPASPVQRAVVEDAVRTYEDAVLQPLPRAWRVASRERLAPSHDGLADALDVAVTGSDVSQWEAPRWWSLVSGLQVVLIVLVVLGGAWLLSLGAMDLLRIPSPEPPAVGAVPIPTLALLGGLLAGLLVAAASRWAVGRSARRRGRHVRAQLEQAVGAAARERVQGPVERELTAAERAAECLGRARGGRIRPA